MRSADTLEKNVLPEGSTKFRLNASYRCDKCSAQAYVNVTLATGELFFCMHHANQYELALMPFVISWYSEEKRLIENRKVGSEN